MLSPGRRKIIFHLNPPPLPVRKTPPGPHQPLNAPGSPGGAAPALPPGAPPKKLPQGGAPPRGILWGGLFGTPPPPKNRFPPPKIIPAPSLPRRAALSKGGGYSFGF